MTHPARISHSSRVRALAAAALERTYKSSSPGPGGLGKVCRTLVCASPSLLRDASRAYMLHSF